MAQDADLLIEAGFSDAKIAKESDKIIAKYRKAGMEAEKAFQDAQGKVSNSQKLKAHTREIDRLSKAYDPVYVATKRYERELKLLNRALELNVIDQKRYKEELVGMQAQLTKASAGVKKFESSFDRAASELEKMKLAYDPVYAATKRYETALQGLDQALAKGAISQDVYNHNLGGMKAELERASSGFETFISGTDQAKTELEQLKMAYDPVYAATKRYEAELARLDQALAKGAISQKVYDSSLGRIKAQLYQASTGTTKFASEADRAASELDQLKRSFDPVYAATKRYKAELETLNRALKAGAINQVQYKANLQRMDKQLATASRSSRSYGGAMQAVGYQVGDFAVQVGAGTSATQALGQQLPQLLGAFGAFGALAGAGAAIMIPLGSALYRVATDARTLEESLEDLSVSTDNYVDAAKLAATPLSELTAQYGDLADEVQRANIAQETIAGISATSNIFENAKKIGGWEGAEPGVIQPRMDRDYNTALADEMDRLRGKIGATKEQFDDLRTTLERLESSDSIESVVTEASALVEITKELYETADDKQREYLKGLIDSTNELLGNAQKQVEASVDDQTRDFQRLQESYDDTTKKLTSLTEDRQRAEELLAKAMKEGDAEKVTSLGRVIVALDENIGKVQELALETDIAFQKIVDRANGIPDVFERMRQSMSVGLPYADEMQTAASKMNAVEMIKNFEHFEPTPYNDPRTDSNGNQVGSNIYRAGYGSDTITLSDKSVLQITKGMTVTMEDANRDLARRIGEFQEGIKDKIGAGRFNSMNEQQQAALTSIAYNYGSLPDRVAKAIREGSTQDIANSIGTLAVHNGGINKKRRLQEASAFGGSEYANALVGRQEELQRESEKKRADRQKDLEAENRERKKRRELVQKYGEQISARLLDTEQEANLKKQLADDTARITALDVSDDTKAAMIAEVNAELEKQRLEYQLINEATRRGVAITDQMVGSTMTYQQAIEALGEAKKQDIIAEQQRSQAMQNVAKQQEFYNGLQQQMQDGLVDSIIAGEKFADVLGNVANMLAKALLQAGLFGSGPLGSGSGIFSGIMSAFGGGGDPLKAALSAIPGVGSYDGGGFTGAGSRSGGVDGKGGFPAILHPNETVIDHTRGQSSGGPVSITVDVRGAQGNSEIRAMVMSGVSEGMSQVRGEVPGIVANHQKRKL